METEEANPIDEAIRAVMVTFFAAGQDTVAAGFRVILKILSCRWGKVFHSLDCIKTCRPKRYVLEPFLLESECRLGPLWSLIVRGFK